MINILSQNGQTTYGLTTYLADTEEDRTNLNTTHLPLGTKCYVIESKKWYILNSSLEWLLYVSGSGGGSNIITEELNVIENGTYTAPTGKAYSPVMVNIPLAAASGSFTIAERSTNVTINLGAELTYVIVAQRSGTGNQFSEDSSRYVFLAVGIRGYSSPTNSICQGALVAISNEYSSTASIASSNTTCVFSENSVTFEGTGIGLNQYAFSPYVTYDWWAW